MRAPTVLALTLSSALIMPTGFGYSGYGLSLTGGAGFEPVGRIPRQYGELGALNEEQARYDLAAAPEGSGAAMAAQADIARYEQRRGLEQERASLRNRAQVAAEVDEREYTNEQRRRIASLQHQQQLVRQSDNLTESDKRSMLEQLEYKIAGVEPVTQHPALRRRQPTVQEELPERVHVDRRNGLAFTKQADGSIESRPIAPRISFADFSKLFADTAKEMTTETESKDAAGKSVFSIQQPKPEDVQRAVMQRVQAYRQLMGAEEQGDPTGTVISPEEMNRKDEAGNNVYKWSDEAPGGYTPDGRPIGIRTPFSGESVPTPGFDVEQPQTAPSKREWTQADQDAYDDWRQKRQDEIDAEAKRTEAQANEAIHVLAKAYDEATWGAGEMPSEGALKMARNLVESKRLPVGLQGGHYQKKLNGPLNAAILALGEAERAKARGDNFFKQSPERTRAQFDAERAVQAMPGSQEEYIAELDKAVQDMDAAPINSAAKVKAAQRVKYLMGLASQ